VRWPELEHPGEVVCRECGAEAAEAAVIELESAEIVTVLACCEHWPRGTRSLFEFIALLREREESRAERKGRQ
jgi:hypothetical protein